MAHSGIGGMSWELNCRSCRARFGATTSTTTCSSNPTPIIGGADAAPITWAKTVRHARAPHAVVLSRQAPLREARRPRRLPRIRLHAMRPPAAVRRRSMIPMPRPPPSRRKSATCAGCSGIAQARGDAEWFRGIRMLLRPLISEGDGHGSRARIRHPAICVIAGHFIHFLTTRGGYAEYVCINCGHPFCFANGRSIKGRPTL